MEQIQRYPLQWPVGNKRTQYPGRSKFKTNLGAAIQEVVEEISRLIYGRMYKSIVIEAEIVISSNVPTRQDGLPYSKYSNIRDHGVAVYFKYKGKPTVLSCDKWNSVECNMHAIAKTIATTRAQERWGVSDYTERAFTGFQALPAPDSQKPWWQRMGFMTSPTTYSEVVMKYRTLAKQLHPDSPIGSTEKFQHLQQIMELAKKHFGVS
jgi:hypothetical protein